MPHIDFAVGIGGAAGQGVATPGNILAKLFARRGLHINAYNAYQSIIRGGHTFLTIRTSEEPVRCMGDDLAMLIPLNQDTMDRHLGRMRAGASVLYDRDRVKPGAAVEGVQLCPLPLAVATGNESLAMGGVAAGVKFYCAYPMSPSTGVLMWMARHGRQLGVMVRQVEDELGVINMAIGAAHTGCRAMCATSGGGFALMTEALGAAAMMEIPLVAIDVQRAGPATGVPTKTEQGDLWQVLGAGQGDYPRLIVAPTTIADCFRTVPELFNLVDRFQCPGIILSDLLISEGRSSVDPAELDFNQVIDRGATIGLNGHLDEPLGEYKRYEFTDSGVSPRAIPGTPGYVHVVATDEHDDVGGLISDEYTNPHKRRAMHEKRMRKTEGVLPLIAPPQLHGSAEADVTLVGWGSTEGVIREAIEQLASQG